MAVEHPLIAVLIRRHLYQRRIWAATSGSVMAKHERAVPHERLQILLFLLISAPVQQRVLVSFIWRLGIQHKRPDRQLTSADTAAMPSNQVPFRPTPQAYGEATTAIRTCFFAQLDNALNDLTAFRLIDLFPPADSIHKFANSESNLFDVGRKN